AKTARSSQRWGEPPQGEIPAEYECQVQWQMGLYRRQAADVPVLFAGQDFRIYTRQFDQEHYELMVEKAEKFWKDHVEAKIAPTISFTEGSKRWLKKFQPDPVAVAVPDDMMEFYVKELQALKIGLESHEKAKTATENRIKAFMAEATKMTGNGWSITWNAVKARTKTDWEAAFRDLVDAAEGLPLRESDDDILKRHTTTGEPTRRFVAKWEGDR